MSNGAAIAACSTVLQQLFQESLVEANLAGALGAAPAVTVLPPDRVTIGTSEAPQLNLFMYNTTPNLGWTNRELPSHNSAGARATAAPLGIDLHYVISAYGASDIQGDVLLGHAALVLHRTRLLSRERIAALAALGNESGIPVGLRTLVAASGLDEQEEQIRLTWERLNVDEISKLWSVFGERYRPSLAFSASLMVMRPDVAARVAPPVAVANLRVLPLPIAGIDRVTPDQVAVGDTIVIEGHGLRSNTTILRFGGAEGEDLLLPAEATSQRIEITVPVGVRAGLSAVQVIHSVDFGPEAIGPDGGLRQVADSNIAPLVVRPDFDDVDISIVGAIVTIAVTPRVAQGQPGRIILRTLGGGDQFVIDLPRAPASSATVSFDRTDVPAGNYLVQVEIGGIASRLGPPGASPTGPTVVLP